SCFITVRGAVEICADSGGRRIKLALHGPGAMFGEAGLFSRQRRTATGWARENSILLEVERAAFERLFEQDSIVAFKFFDAAVEILVQIMRRAIARQAWLETARRGLLS
ncbi:MAG TPA: cyclic nucleotide-binding domain-containing protein, partial [Gammaproteobacteria bacterium]|nr:cyclic nucleotide-binding domain-containing protein [Gammaproteobacteria bacterium]